MSDPAFDCKYIWGHRSFEEELKKIREKVKKERGIDLPPSNLTFILADDLRSGRISIDPTIVRFRKQKILKVGSSSIKMARVK